MWYVRRRAHAHARTPTPTHTHVPRPPHGPHTRYRYVGLQFARRARGDSVGGTAAEPAERNSATSSVSRLTCDPRPSLAPCQAKVSGGKRRGLGSITREVRAAGGPLALAIAAFALERTGRAAVAVDPRPGATLDDVFHHCVRAVGVNRVRRGPAPRCMPPVTPPPRLQLPRRDHWFLHGQPVGGATVSICRTRTGKAAVGQTVPAPHAAHAASEQAITHSSEPTLRARGSLEAARGLLLEAAALSSHAPVSPGEAPLPTDSLGAALLCARFEATRPPGDVGPPLSVAAVLQAAAQDAEAGGDACTVALLQRVWRADGGVVPTTAAAGGKGSGLSPPQRTEPLAVQLGAAGAVNTPTPHTSTRGPARVLRVISPGDTQAEIEGGAPWRVPLLRCVDADLCLVLGRQRTAHATFAPEEWFALGACHGGCVVAVRARDGAEAWRVQLDARVHSPPVPVVHTGCLLVTGCVSARCRRCCSTSPPPLFPVSPGMHVLTAAWMLPQTLWSVVGAVHRERRLPLHGLAGRQPTGSATRLRRRPTCALG